MNLTIEVTKEIIEQSANCHKHILSENCAVALAVRKVFPIERDATVSNTTIWLKDYSSLKNDTVIYLPTEAIIFIRDFDRSSPKERLQMSPIRFEIEVPAKVFNQYPKGS